MEPDALTDLHFPKAGTDLSRAFSKQPVRALEGGEYTRTTPLGKNVRAWQPEVYRARGSQRSGLVKYTPQPVIADWIVQELNVIVTTEGTPVELSQSGRAVTLVAVSQGNVYTLLSGDTFWVPATNNTGFDPPLNFTGVVYSANNNQLMYFADGINFRYYKPDSNSVENWVATAGLLPVDSANNAPRLICTWRGRTVVSGLLLDEQNWFMSAVSDPTNFDYAPLSASPTQAVAGNNGPLGLIGDVVTTLIPYSDDVLIFGGDSTIYLMQGDPMAGGQIDLVTSAIGMAWGQPWCRDPYGTIYFFSSRTGIFTLLPGQKPVRISQAIEQQLLNIDTGANTVRAIWDDRFQGCHFFVTPTAAPAATTHFFYEQRTGAWWQDTFANNDHNPLCCCTFDGNDPNDRVSLIGSFDGYVRAISPTASDDDGYPIDSEVIIGPLLTANLDDVLLKSLQAVLGETSGDVQYAVYVGSTAEKALSSDPVLTGTWKAGRNLTNLVRRAGHAIYIKISSTNPWAMESVRVVIAGQGKVRRRGH
jgi:hypothetical protein